MHIKKITLQTEDYPTNERYPFNLQILRETKSLELKTPITFFVGENGSGKTTLLEAISHRCGIHIWHVEEGRRFDKNPFERALFNFIRVQWVDELVPGSYFSAQSHRYFSQALDNWAAADPGQMKYFGGRSLMSQSHGQSLMSLFRNRYKIKGLYLSDEPESALSPTSQLELLRLIRKMSEAGHAQFIIATHSPILLACPGATIFSFNHVPVKEVSYEETEYYKVYKDFFEDRERYLEAV